MDIKVKSEFKQLIPPLTKAEYDGLETSIVNEGCRDAILVWLQDGFEVIVDGHNRYEICQKHNIPFEIKDISFESEDDAGAWIIQNQFNRRNLSTYQRSVLALQLADIFREKGKANQVRTEDNRVCQISDEQSIDTKKELAKIAGVSHDTIMRVKKIEEVSPFFVREMLAVGDMSINEAYKMIKKNENKDERIAREAEDVISNSNVAPIIIYGDCMDFVDKIPPIDLLIADPPYFTDGDFTSHLSSYLGRVKSTGQAYLFSGAEPKEVGAYISMASGDLRLEQILVWNYNNTGQKQPNTRYNSNYQLCFYYRGIDAPPINKPTDGKEQYACQTINAPDGRVGDRYFKWQKPLDLIERFIKNSSSMGDFVFDPFAGSGTTLIAAGKLGRRAAGCEIDDGLVELCVERGCVNGTANELR